MSKKPKKEKYKAHLFAHPNYDRILREIRKKYIDESEPDYLAVPYVLMCATALEARLNDELYNYALSAWQDNFSMIAQSYLSINFKGKLNAFVSILTNDRYRINQDHFVYQRLASLIKVRNTLAHPKPSIQDYEIVKNDPMTWPPFQLPLEFYENVSDLTLGSTDAFTPLEYHEAMEKLEKWFFNRCPDRLSKIAMVVANEQNKQTTPADHHKS